MRKVFTCLYFITILSFLGCDQTGNTLAKPTISVSILPLKYLVDEITGEKVDVNVLVPEGVNPETFEPLPLQFKALSASSMYFQIGLIDFEKSLYNGASHSNPKLKTLNLSEGIDLIDGACSNNEHHHHGTDPHIWLSPGNMKKIAFKITSELSKILPESSEIFNKNYKLLSESIDSLDRYTLNSFKEINNRHFLIYHPFLGYFARDYGLTQISIENEGKEPSVQHMKSIINEIHDKKITTIFYQKQDAGRSVHVLSTETNIKSVMIDPLNYNWLENMYKITDLLKESLNEVE